MALGARLGHNIRVASPDPGECWVKHCPRRAGLTQHCWRTIASTVCCSAVDFLSHPLAIIGVMSSLLEQEAIAMAAKQHGAMHRDQLTATGHSSYAIRRAVHLGLIRPLTRDVFLLAGAPDTWLRQLWAAHLELGAGSAVSRRAAAALLTLPGYESGRVEILRKEQAPHPSRLATMHQSSWLPPAHLTTVDGLPCTSLARTLFDLAGLSSPNRLRRGRSFVHERRVERTVDHAITQLGLRIDQLADVLATLGGRGRPGTQLMRRIIDARGEGYVATDSELEDLLCDVLEAHGLPRPERQRALGGDLPAGRVDVVYLDARLVIEADSRLHHTALIDADADRWRDIELAAAGFTVIRVTWWILVHEPDRFADRVSRVLQRAVA